MKLIEASGEQVFKLLHIIILILLFGRLHVEVYIKTKIIGSALPRFLGRTISIEWVVLGRGSCAISWPVLHLHALTSEWIAHTLIHCVVTTHTTDILRSIFLCLWGVCIHIG